MGRTAAQWMNAADRELISLVSHFGENRWPIIVKYLQKDFPMSRINEAKCKDRWSILKKRRNMKSLWSLAEEYLFFETHSIIGNRWTILSYFFPSKSDNNLKNHFYACLRKSIRRASKKRFDLNKLNFVEKVKTFYAVKYLLKYKNERNNKNNFKISDLQNGYLINFEPEWRLFRKQLERLFEENKMSSLKLTEMITRLSYRIITDPFIMNLITSSFPMLDYSHIQQIGIHKILHLMVKSELLRKCLEYMRYDSLDEKTGYTVFRFIRENLWDYQMLNIN